MLLCHTLLAGLHDVVQVKTELGSTLISQEYLKNVSKCGVPKNPLLHQNGGSPKKSCCFTNSTNISRFSHHLGGETPPPLSLAAKARHPAAAAAKLRRQLRTAETNLEMKTQANPNKNIYKENGCFPKNLKIHCFLNNWRHKPFGGRVDDEITSSLNRTLMLFHLLNRMNSLNLLHKSQPFMKHAKACWCSSTFVKLLLALLVMGCHDLHSSSSQVDLKV